MLYECYCKTSHNTLPNTLQVFTPSESPNNSWGAKWPGGLTDPSCPGEEVLALNRIERVGSGRSQCPEDKKKSLGIATASSPEQGRIKKMSGNQL